MNQSDKAVFNLENYRISHFSFSDPENEEQQLNIAFNPSGLFFKGESRFVLQFEFLAAGSEDGKQIIKAKMIASFQFVEKIEYGDIPPYFYKNAIAIVFPFMRSFVSTLTLLAGVKQLILPILNLSSLESTLIENTVVPDMGFTERDDQKLIS